MVGFLGVEPQLTQYFGHPYFRLHCGFARTVWGNRLAKCTEESFWGDASVQVGRILVFNAKCMPQYELIAN